MALNVHNSSMDRWGVTSSAHRLLFPPIFNFRSARFSLFMPDSVPPPTQVRFELDTQKRTVQLNGASVSLGARAFDLLVALHARRERMVPKNELLDLVWPGHVVEESNIQVQVSALRKALGRDALATIPGRGYQWTLNDTQPTASASALKSMPLSARGLIGRDVEIAALSSLLATSRWVVILGAGGIGKTSLARAVIAQYRNLHAETATEAPCWVDLTTIERPDQLVAAIGKAATIVLRDDQNAEAELFQVLSGRSFILVLDNCEHVAERVVQWTTELLARAPTIRVLATSQEPFRSTVVHTYRVQALAVPAIDATPARIREADSVTLLLRRAQAANHTFEVSDVDLPLAANVCRELEGLPLAIEMAAARLPVLGIRGLNARLSDRLKLFRSNYPNLPPRQQTLRGALEWTYSLLTERAQRLLLFLSEFVGGFRLDAAQTVAEHVGIDEIETLDVLSVLVDKSLVSLDSTDPLRYRILETTRLFSQECLLDGGLKLQSADAHCAATVRLTALLAHSIRTEPEGVWSSIFQPDYDNIDAAFSHGVARKDPKVIADCASALFILEEVGTFISPRISARVRAAYEALEDADVRTRAKLLNSVATAVHIPHPVIARQTAAQLRLEAWRALGDEEQVAAALAQYAMDSAGANDLKAAHEAIDAIERIDQSKFSLNLRLSIARITTSALAYMGETGRPIKLLLRLLETAELAGSARRAAITRMQLGDMMFMSGDLAAAIEYGKQAVTALAAMKQSIPLRYAYANVCAALCFANQIDHATLMAIESLNPAVMGHSINVQADSLALVAASRGAFAVAARMLGVADVWYDATGMAREPSELQVEARASTLIAEQVSAWEFTGLRKEGAAMNPIEVAAMIRHSLGASA
jgi:predicted ATPase/DNA-binding winged helix-turn-helix (wHTH) protein